MTVRVLLVEDHAVFAETLASALKRAKDFDVVGIATTAERGGELARELLPDVALLDVGLPDYDGLQLAREMRASTPKTRIVILTASTDASLFAKAMALGASGYLIKDSTFEEVQDAIRKASEGLVVVPEGAIGRLTEAKVPREGIGSELTQRELELLALLGQGSDLRAISKAMGITWNTTRSYLKNVLIKMDAHSQLEAVAKAMRLGILTTKPEAPA